jgi:hypothetical protein
VAVVAFLILHARHVNVVIPTVAGLASATQRGILLWIVLQLALAAPTLITAVAFLIYHAVHVHMVVPSVAVLAYAFQRRISVWVVLPLTLSTLALTAGIPNMHAKRRIRWAEIPA